jgi:hypothetical protein
MVEVATYKKKKKTSSMCLVKIVVEIDVGN